MANSKFPKKSNELLAPILEKLTEMILLVRNAFNRQTASYLEDADRLRRQIEQDIETGRAELRKAASPQNAEARGDDLEKILDHMEVIKKKMAEMMEPLQNQIRGGILFSDKAISQTNFLFDHEAGIFRSLEDILMTGNDILVSYVNTKIDEMHRFCVEFATDHEARLIEGLCQPQAAPIFLAILNCIREISHQEKDILKHLQG